MLAILGATGKTGLGTIRRLRARNVPVRAVVRAGSMTKELHALGCEIVIADVNDGPALAEALRGASTVQVICPIQPQSTDAAADMQRSVEQIGAALESARPEHVLAISDYGAHLTHGTGIALVFHRFEQQLRRLPAALTLLRSAEHLQNWSRVLRPAIEAGKLPGFHDPVTKLFPTVSAYDVGEIAAELLQTPPAPGTVRIAHAEGQQRTSIADIAAVLSRVTGRPIEPVSVPRAGWSATFARGGLSDSYAALVAEMYDAHNRGLIDVEAGAGELYRGRSTLEQVLRSLVA